MSIQGVPFELVRVSRSGPVAVVAMHRAHKRNAMNEQLLTELRQALQQQEEDDGVDVVALTGEGTVFSAGADRSAVAALEGDERTAVFAPIAAHLSALMGDVVLQLVAMRKPVVAAVNGHAAGGGFMTALGCDFRIVAEDAQFWMPEIDLGRAISDPAMETLLALVGPAMTKDIVITGRRMAAAELSSLGLSTRIVPRAEVMSAALEFARALAARDQRAVRTIKARANRRLVEIWSEPRRQKSGA